MEEACDWGHVCVYGRKERAGLVQGNVGTGSLWTSSPQFGFTNYKADMQMCVAALPLSQLVPNLDEK